MKKILFAIALIFFAGTTLNAQPAQTDNRAATFSARSDKEMNLITESSVGPLALGQKMPTAAPAGAFFTTIKKFSYYKNSGTTYLLLDGKDTVGYVTTHPTKNTITEITTLSPKTATANGIIPGMSLVSAISKPDVKIEIEYSYDADSWAISFEYGKINFFAGESEFFYGLTNEAFEKIQSGFYSGDPIFQLTPEYFDGKTIVSEIKISL